MQFIPLIPEDYREFFDAAHRETSRLTYGTVLSDTQLEGEYARSLKYAKTDPHLSVIALLDGKPVGICQLEVREYGEKYGWVHFYYIAPEERGKGYGKQLVEYSAKYFRKLGLAQMFLKVGIPNVNAEMFYKRVGFMRKANADSDTSHMMVFHLGGLGFDIAEALKLYGNCDAYEVSDNTGGPSDNRYTMFADFADGGKIVVKAARNGFTTPERVAGWAELTEHYNSLGIYAPNFVRNIHGEYSAVVGDYVIYAEELAKFETDMSFDYDVSAEARLTTLGKVAANPLTPPLPWSSPYAMYDKFDDSDEYPELYDNALNTIRKICEVSPIYADRATTILSDYERLRAEFEPVYRSLPKASFQADMNKSNLLFDNGAFVGLMDFNLSGTDAVISYAMYEGFYYMTDDEIVTAIKTCDTTQVDERIRRNFGYVARMYKFGDAERFAFGKFYNIAAPFWGAHFQKYGELVSVHGAEIVPQILDFIEWQMQRDVVYRQPDLVL
ncbi:MAG: GNAT family N-acetyltransferase [Oscillospiraceae bacterium]|jgi:GNAT superfamily N-acetyltransferase|nr:GNAT family N-acetyltransferase [Oscillospiraceae bacterium]